jgi:hypothetical protein
MIEKGKSSISWCKLRYISVYIFLPKTSVRLLFILLFHIRTFWALTWFIEYIYYWNLVFLNNIIILRSKVLLPRTILSNLFGPLVFLLLTSLASQSLDYEHTWRRLFQERILWTKLNIYVLLVIRGDVVCSI